MVIIIKYLYVIGRKQLSADEILDILINGDTSDLEISDDEDKSDEPENFNEQQIQQDTEAETVSPNSGSGGDEDDDDDTGTTGDRTHGRRHFWKKTDRYVGLGVVISIFLSFVFPKTFPNIIAVDSHNPILMLYFIGISDLMD